MKPYFILIAVYIFLQLTDSADIQISPAGEKFTKAIGGSSLFTCSILDAEEGDQVSLHWFDNKGTEILESSGRRFVEDDEEHTKMLYITSIDASDVGTFTCRANVGEEQFEKIISFDIFHDLKIEANDTQNPIMNTDALIACQVSGDPNYKVSWKKDGKRLLGSRYMVDSLKGLTIEKITDADNGIYMCRADIRKLGIIRSKNINVVVHIPPRISLEQNLVEVVEIEKAVLKCQATGNPKPTFSFTKVGSDDAIEPNGNILIDAEVGTLEFLVVQQEDAGAYICTASNHAGSDTATIVLNVLVPSKILKFLSLEVKGGEEANLRCELEGHPKPEVKFSKTNGPDNLIDEKPDRFSTMEEDDAVVLVIHSVEPEDSGEYICSAKNSVGQDHLEMQLLVKYLPIMTKSSAEFEYNWLSHSVNFSCEAKAIPSPTFHWAKYESDENISDNETYAIFNSENMSILQVKVGENDESWIYGKYHCIASNDLGEVSRDFYMKKAVTPDKPMQVTLVEAHPTMLLIEISPPESDGGLPVLAYIVEYKKYTVDETGEMTPPPVAEGLEAHKSEDGADVESENEPGESKFDSKEHDAISEEDTSDHTNKEDNMSDAMMADEAVADHKDDDEHDHDEHDDDGEEEVWVKASESEDTKVSLMGLEPETEYILRVRAKNTVGYGLPYIFNTKTTSHNVPAMVDLTSKGMCQKPYEFKAAWKVPYDGGLPITTYVVKYKLSKDGANLTALNPKLLGWSEKLTNETQINLVGLRSQSTYVLQVHARNSLGLSPAHDEFVFKTCKDSLPISKTALEVGKPELSASTEVSSGKGVVIGIVIAVLLILAIATDVICCCSKKRGLTFMCFNCIRGGNSKDNKTQAKKKKVPTATLR